MIFKAEKSLPLFIINISHDYATLIVSYGLGDWSTTHRVLWLSPAIMSAVPLNLLTGCLPNDRARISHLYQTTNKQS